MSIVKRFSKKDHDKSLYNSQRWRDASKRFLTLNPLCLHCERQKKITPSSETDHIIPHKGNLSLFWDHSNWQPLCKVCHSLKTSGETRSITKYPTVYNKPICGVTIICTPLCWDYLPYIRELHHTKPMYVVVSQQPNATLQQHNEFIKEINTLHQYDAHTHVYVVVDEPLPKVRNHYAHQLNANVVVIQIDSTDPYAIKFYDRFVKDLNDEIVYA